MKLGDACAVIQTPTQCGGSVFVRVRACACVCVYVCREGIVRHIDKYMCVFAWDCMYIKVTMLRMSQDSQCA